MWASIAKKLALGYLSTIPVVSLGITILVAHSLCGMFGVALGAVVMLGTLTMGMPSAPCRTTRVASLRCRNLLSGSENVLTYLAQ